MVVPDALALQHHINNLYDKRRKERPAYNELWFIDRRTQEWSSRTPWGYSTILLIYMTKGERNDLHTLSYALLTVLKQWRPGRPRHHDITINGNNHKSLNEGPGYIIVVIRLTR
jgi:hypothetical protein